MAQPIQPQAYTNRRRHERFQTRLPIRYGLTSPDVDAMAEKISAGGLYVSTNRPPKVGTRLVVHIDFDGRTLILRGEVVWAIRVPEHLKDSMVCGMGIEFLEPGPEWHRFFRRWSEERHAAD